MSKFIDINEQRGRDQLPTVALNYDGVFIEEQIEGYRTLTVSGREVINYDITTLGDSIGRDGTMVGGKSATAREIVIQYELKADDPETFQSKFRAMMRILYNDKDVDFYFNDDPTVIYKGQLTAMDDVPSNSNSIISSFTLYCQDPMKYGSSAYVYGGDVTSVVIDDPTNIVELPEYPILPEYIDIMTVEGSGSTFNTLGLTFRLNSYNDDMDYDPVMEFDFKDYNLEFTNNQRLRINIREGIVHRVGFRDGFITRDKSNLIPFMDFVKSDFHRFKIKANSRIVLTSNNSNLVLRVVVRSEWR